MECERKKQVILVEGNDLKSGDKATVTGETTISKLGSFLLRRGFGGDTQIRI